LRSTLNFTFLTVTTTAFIAPSSLKPIGQVVEGVEVSPAEVVASPVLTPALAVMAVVVAGAAVEDVAEARHVQTSRHQLRPKTHIQGLSQNSFQNPTRDAKLNF
jgi:hypothetical protein